LATGDRPDDEVPVRHRYHRRAHPRLRLSPLHRVRRHGNDGPLPEASRPPAVPRLDHRARLHAARVRLPPGLHHRPHGRRRSTLTGERKPTMARIDGSLLTTTGENQLAHGSLRVWDAIAISVSLIAPGMAMLLNTTGVAAAAGGSTPLAFLLGGIGCLALA